MGLLSSFHNRFTSLFSTDSDPKIIGIFGPANAGKSTLTNQIIEDWDDNPDEDDLVDTSEVPHETRRADRKDEVVIERGDSSITIDIVDTPGVATKIDHTEFEEFGIDSDQAHNRSREASEGIAESMHWLREDVDGVIYVMDSTRDPLTQMNTMLIGIVESHDLPTVILANKTDLPESDVSRVRDAFPQHPVVPVSALEGENLEQAYDKFTETFN